MEREPVSTASELRRMARLRATASERRRQIIDMIRWGLSTREMYEEGKNDGKHIRVRSLSDVLVAIKECGLGTASILEESNEHVIIRVYGSLCCQLDLADDSEGKKCYYLAGFIAGTMESTGCSSGVSVRELHCSGDSGNACMFFAGW
jgi:predicted hydrocarbon binding protein